MSRFSVRSRFNTCAAFSGERWLTTNVIACACSSRTQVENLARIHLRDRLHGAERGARGGRRAPSLAGLETAERLFQRVAASPPRRRKWTCWPPGPRRKIPAKSPAAARGVIRLNRAISREIASISRGWNCRRITAALSEPEHDQQRGQHLHFVQAPFSAATFGGASAVRTYN